jgi:hypothetical protein
LNVEVRLAIPVSELFRLFLQRHPTEKQIIEGTLHGVEAKSAFDIVMEWYGIGWDRIV